MDSWLTYPEYLAQHPGSALTEAEFTPRAVDAAFFIENATRWRASLAKEPEQLALLAQCQSRLVALSEEVSASWDGVTSVSNPRLHRELCQRHGYAGVSGQTGRARSCTRCSLLRLPGGCCIRAACITRPADAERRPAMRKPLLATKSVTLVHCIRQGTGSTSYTTVLSGVSCREVAAAGTAHSPVQAPALPRKAAPRSAFFRATPQRPHRAQQNRR